MRASLILVAFLDVVAPRFATITGSASVRRSKGRSCINNNARRCGSPWNNRAFKPHARRDAKLHKCNNNSDKSGMHFQRKGSSREVISVAGPVCVPTV